MFVYIFGLFNLLVCVTTLFGHSGLFVLFFVGLVQFGCFVWVVCVCVFGWLLAWVVGILGRWVVCFSFHQQRALLGSSAQISCGAAPGQVPEGCGAEGSIPAQLPGKFQRSAPVRFRKFPVQFPKSSKFWKIPGWFQEGEVPDSCGVPFLIRFRQEVPVQWKVSSYIKAQPKNDQNRSVVLLGMPPKFG